MDNRFFPLKLGMKVRTKVRFAGQPIGSLGVCINHIVYGLVLNMSGMSKTDGYIFPNGLDSTIFEKVASNYVCYVPKNKLNKGKENGKDQ